GPAADGSPAASLPPGLRAHPIVQTLAWAVAPTWLMDSCASRVGDSFTITFWPSRFQLVLVSNPDAVKATFTAPPEIAPAGARREARRAPGAPAAPSGARLTTSTR